MTVSLRFLLLLSIFAALIPTKPPPTTTTCLMFTYQIVTSLPQFVKLYKEIFFGVFPISSKILCLLFFTYQSNFRFTESKLSVRLVVNLKPYRADCNNQRTTSARAPFDDGVCLITRGSICYWHTDRFLLWENR